MSKVTSKLQVTIPKRLAERLGIRPGDDVEWTAAGDALRLAPHVPARAMLTVEERVRLFDVASRRQREREQTAPRRPAATDRGWRRQDLYGRARPR